MEIAQETHLNRRRAEIFTSYIWSSLTHHLTITHSSLGIRIETNHLLPNNVRRWKSFFTSHEKFSFTQLSEISSAKSTKQRTTMLTFSNYSAPAILRSPPTQARASSLPSIAPPPILPRSVLAGRKRSGRCRVQTPPKMMVHLPILSCDSHNQPRQHD